MLESVSGTGTSHPCPRSEFASAWLLNPLPALTGLWSLPLTAGSGHKGRRAAGWQVGCGQWVVALAAGSVQLWWKPGYLRRGGEAAAPLALKGRFIPRGSLLCGPLLRLPVLPLGREYSSVSQPVCPPPPTSLATERHRGRVCDYVRSRGVGAGWAGWEAWLGLTETRGRFSTG